MQPLRSFDASSIGVGNDQDEMNKNPLVLPEQGQAQTGLAEFNESGAIVVWHLSFDNFERN